MKPTLQPPCSCVEPYNCGDVPSPLLETRWEVVVLARLGAGPWFWFSLLSPVSWDAEGVAAVLAEVPLAVVPVRDCQGDTVGGEQRRVVPLQLRKRPLDYFF